MTVNLVPIRCTNCSAAIAPENIVEKLSLARCQHCDTVFAIVIPGRGGNSSVHANRARVPMPSHIQKTVNGDELMLVRRWWAAKYLFLGFFAVFWNGFMIVWHTLAISEGAWIMSLFGLFHTGVGLGLIYSVAGGIFNKTYIRVSRQQISIKHAPIPWRGNRTIDATKVGQLYCVEKSHRGKNGTSYSYTIRAVMADGTRENIIDSLGDIELAIYLEQELEHHLGIADYEVDGEMSRA